MYRKWTDIQLKEAVETSYSFREMSKKLGVVVSGAEFKLLKKHIKRLNLSIEHFTSKPIVDNWKEQFKTKPLNEFFVKNSTRSSKRVKERLLKEGLLDYKCNICGQEPIWNGKKLVLQLDHINGVNSDNRLTNLQILCPNCHTQTSTFCMGTRIKKLKVLKGRKYGYPATSAELARDIRNRRIKNRPSKEKLKELIKEHGYCGTGRMFGVSDNAVRKWLK